uniref:Uncharacterized protein n=1 Tax=Anguilla anguilla TaxID=7936 RepID=A0A0E9V1L5_ANGAN
MHTWMHTCVQLQLLRIRACSSEFCDDAVWAGEPIGSGFMGIMRRYLILSVKHDIGSCF